MASQKLKDLNKQLLQLTPQSKLTVASGLLDLGKNEHAEMVIRAALEQIQGIRLFGAETYERLAQIELSKL